MRRAPRGSHRAPIIGRSSEGSPSRCSPAFSKRRAKQRKQAGQRAALFRRRPNHLTRDQCRRTKPAYALVRLIRLAHEAARSGVPASATASGQPPGRAGAHASEKCGRHMASAKHGKPREEIAIAAPCVADGEEPCFPAARPSGRRGSGRRRPGYDRNRCEARAKRHGRPRRRSGRGAARIRGRRRPPPPDSAHSAVSGSCRSSPPDSFDASPSGDTSPPGRGATRGDEGRRCAPRPVRSPPRYHWYETPAPYVLP